MTTVLSNIDKVFIYQSDLKCSMQEFRDKLSSILVSYSTFLDEKGTRLCVSFKKRGNNLIAPNFEKDLEKIIQNNVKSFSRIIWKR